MQAIILAAGMGKRLKKLTANNTKCMVKVNGVTLIERMLSQLEKLHLSRIVIVVGYKKENLIDYISTLKIQTPIIFVDNSIYDKTNNIYSLFLASDYLRREDTILLESDLIFDDSILKMLVEDTRDTLALVDKYESWMDGTCLKLTEDDKIKSFIPGKEFNFEDRNEYYKTVNIYKFSRHFSEKIYLPFLEAYSKALGNNEYYEQVLKVIMMLEEPEIRAKRLNSDGGGVIQLQIVICGTKLTTYRIWILPSQFSIQMTKKNFQRLKRAMADIGVILKCWIFATWLIHIFRHKN